MQAYYYIETPYIYIYIYDEATLHVQMYYPEILGKEPRQDVKKRNIFLAAVWVAAKDFYGKTLVGNAIWVFRALVTALLKVVW